MPTKRKKLGAQEAARVTPEAISAWRTGDYWGLYRALRLKIWEMPDWGFDPPMEEASDLPLLVDRHRYVCAMKRALMDAAGPPPRRWFFQSDGVNPDAGHREKSR
jgi:hypothetical protein